MTFTIMEEIKALKLTNARIVTPQENFIGSVIIEDGIITEITKNTLNDALDLSGKWLVPGCIDIHSDYLEKELHPRPSANFPLPFAFHFMDQRAAACGITTLFTAISYTENLSMNRTYEDAIEKSKELDKIATSGIIRHYIHSRLDPNSERVLDYLDAMKEIDSLKLVVVNESIPGQRQFKLEDLIAKRAKTLQISLEESEKLLLEQIAERSKVDKRPEIMEAFQHIMPIGSHDDTTVLHVEEAKQYGATLSEMPTTIEAARKARDLGLAICMGAPNYVRGGSHCGNLACHEALSEGLVDMLCSDYHFPTMLTSVLKMIQEGIDPSEAVGYVSLNPAKFLNMDKELGSIEVGKKADLVAFKEAENFAKVSHLWVDGKLKFTSDVEESKIPTQIEEPDFEQAKVLL